MPTILRRRKLGRTSCREIARNSQTNIRAVRNDQAVAVDDDIVFRWGCTSNVMTRSVVNTARAIHQVNDKVGFRVLLDEHELCPTTWTRLEDIPIGDLQAQGKSVIVRPAKHAQGRRLYHCRNRVELVRAIEACGRGWYAGLYIEKVSEYRIFIVSGRVVAVARKTPADPNAIAWNVARGGRFDNVRFNDWPLKAVRIAIEGFNLSDLDFGGVDVMLDNEGEVYILEINSAPSLTSEYRQQCFAKAFDYIVRNDKARIPLIQEKGGYRKFIHPAIVDNAKLVGEV